MDVGDEEDVVEFDLSAKGAFLLTLVRRVDGEGRHMRQLPKAEFGHVRIQSSRFGATISTVSSGS